MERFSEQKHHALMAALIYKHIELECPENSSEVIRKVVSDYGAARGRLARKNTLSQGDPLTVENYFAYKSLRTEEGVFIENVLQNDSMLKTEVTKCCWMDNWRKYDLTEYGKLYCESCDTSMMEAYNPDIPLEIPQLMEHDGKDTCVFIWPGVQVDFDAVKEKKATLGTQFVLNWSQLTDHLCESSKNSLNEISPGLGDQVLELALREFRTLPD